MKLDRVIRIAIAVLILLVFIIAIGAMLFLTEAALNVWDRLVEGPKLLLYGYLSVMVALVIAAIWLIWRLVVRRKIPKVKKAATRELSKSDIKERLRDAEASGVDVSAAQAELRDLATRQEAGAIHLCFFGEISTGKSSLIKALVPAAEVSIDVLGGSTTDIQHYRWHSESGSEILLTDVPGTGGLDKGLGEQAIEEAQRSHVVLFVCGGDLARPEALAVERLLTLGKPLVLVMNKSDRFDVEEQAALMQRLLEHLEKTSAAVDRDRVVAVSAGGEVDVIERAADGSETEAQYRVQRSEQIIRNSTRKAVVGALAAVSPGTDVLIQGYIGTVMTQELCKLYGAAPRDLDIEEFLNLSQSRVGRALPLSLAVAGNGLKAFPGLGTVAGGLVHAVAYGLIFDALGRSLVLTLSRHGEFVPEVAAKEFEDGISEHINAGVRRVAQMALDEKQG